MVLLTGTEPANLGWQEDLAKTQQWLGTVLQAERDLAGALAEFKADLAVMTQLAASNPGKDDLQQQLASGHNRVGDLLEKGEYTRSLARVSGRVGAPADARGERSGEHGWARPACFCSFRRWQGLIQHR